MELGYRETIENTDIEKQFQQLREHDEDTFFHSVRVAAYAEEFGNCLRMDTDFLWKVGRYHDIGKLKITDRSLFTKITYTDEDHSIMQGHVLFGWEILNEAGQHWLAETTLRHHHFRKGPYPKHMPAPRIDLTLSDILHIKEYARVLALADRFDALKFRFDRDGSPSTADQKWDIYWRENMCQSKLISILKKSGALNF